jgi:hypothetical protein
MNIRGYRRPILGLSFLAAVALLVVGPSAVRVSGDDHAGALGGPRLYSAEGTRAGSAKVRSAEPPRPVTGPEVKHDTSPPLRTIPPQNEHRGRKEHIEHPIPVPAGSGTPDPVVQTAAPLAAAPIPGPSFGGVPVQDSAPPDTNGAVGPNAYVQIVNEQFQVFTKSGTSLYGPANTSTLWAGFGGGCQTNNDGDATVVYDRLAGRWIIQQFSVSTTPYLECIAVSATGDPTGAWHRYSFGGFGSNFPDYPKLGVWPDAYYVTYNLFSGGLFFVGPEVCAYSRAQMLAGAAATQQCKPVNDTNLGGLLPSDVDSATPPPAGAPNYVLAFDTNVLERWKFHVDWATPANSTLTGPTTISVAAFDPACGGGGCIPQGGTGQTLDSLGDRLMYRLAYRNFGDHESRVVSHAVTPGNSVGMRWYELRNPNGSPPTVFQQGTYAPDSKFRWMGSAAMDGSGDIALGFSISGTSMFPSIGYTGRLAGDPLGTMTQGETVLQAGGGSQTGGLDRWGDYSSMSIDPSDDCTFWYTNEYLPANGSFNWRTRIGSFTLPGCGVAVANDFSIAANPTAVSVQQGQSGGTTIDTAVTAGAAQAVSLSASGQPAGATVSFNPASVTAGGSSTMTIDVGTGTLTGPYTITVTGTGASATHTTTVALTVTAPSDDFSIAANPTAVSIEQGQGGGTTIDTAVTTGATQAVSLSASGQPAGATVSFNPASVTAGGSSTMTIDVGPGTATGVYTITVTGTGTSATHTATVSLTVTAAASDFSIAANPTSLVIKRGKKSTTTISTAVVAGSAQTVTLSASGQPNKVAVSFSSKSITAGGSSIMTVKVNSGAHSGSFTITVTGTSATATHTVTVALQIKSKS